MRVRPAGKDKQAERQGGKDEGAEEGDEVSGKNPLPGKGPVIGALPSHGMGREEGQRLFPEELHPEQYPLFFQMERYRR